MLRALLLVALTIGVGAVGFVLLACARLAGVAYRSGGRLDHASWRKSSQRFD